MWKWKLTDRLGISHSLSFLKNAVVRAQLGNSGPQAEKSARDVFNAVGGVETLTAARVLTPADSGKTFFLAEADGFDTELPEPEPGLRYSFIVAVSPTDGDYTISTAGGANILVVSVNELDTDTGDDGPYDDDADVLTLVEDIALIGDRVDMISDGAKWYAWGQTAADGAVTTATT